MIRRLARRVAGRVARAAARDPLFEQPGERAVQAPIPAEALARAADLDRLRLAVAPGYGLRVVKHWATWCAPCVEEIPHLVALRRGADPRVRFLGICWDLFDARAGLGDTVGGVARFARDHGIDWPSLVVGPDVEPDAFFSALDVESHLVPQTWVVDGEGRVRLRVEGVVDAGVAGELASLLEDLCA